MPLSIFFRGEPLLVPDPPYPIEIMEAYADQRYLDFYRIMLGDEQFARIRPLMQNTDDLVELGTLIARARGVPGY